MADSRRIWEYQYSCQRCGYECYPNGQHVDGHRPCQGTGITASIPEPQIQDSRRDHCKYSYDPVDNPRPQRLSPGFDNYPTDHHYVQRDPYYDGCNSPRQRYRESFDGDSAYRANSSRRRNPPTRSRSRSSAPPRQTLPPRPPPPASHRLWTRLRTIFGNRLREDGSSPRRPSTITSQHSPTPGPSYDRYHDRSPRSRYTAPVPQSEDNNILEPLYVHRVQTLPSHLVADYGARATPPRHTESYETEIQEHLRANDLRSHGPFRYWGGVPRMRFDDYAWMHAIEVPDDVRDGPTSATRRKGQDRWLDWDWETAENNRPGGRRSAEVLYSDNSPPISLPPPPIGLYRHTRWESGS